MAKPRKKPVKQEKQPQNNQHANVKKQQFHVEFLNAAQKLAWSAFDQHEILFLLGSAGSGKSHLGCAFAISEILAKRKQKIVITRPTIEAGGTGLGYLPGCQPLTQSILTASGWTTMGQIKLGDRVIGRDGMPTEVIGIYPKGKKDTYKVTTFDGTSTICCLDHLWYTQTKEEKNKKQQGKVRSTNEIISDLKNGIKHYLPRNEPVHYDKRNLYIPPYTLGVLLGDGHTEKTRVRFASADQEIVERVTKEVKSMGVYCKQAKKQYSKAWSYTLSSSEGYREGIKPVKLTEIENGHEFYFATNEKVRDFVSCKKGTIDSRINKGAIVDGYKYEKYGEVWRNPVLKHLKQYDLYKKKAWDKFIPDDYKYSSVQDRIDILRGLCDTDGSCRKRIKDQVTFYTTSLRLANDVIEIVRSLGGRARSRSRDRAKEENRNIFARRVSYEVSIAMPKQINPFYLKRKADRFNGKNVSNLEITSIEKIGHEDVQCIKIDNQEHLYLTDDFIVTHNTADEKLHPYMLPLFDCMDRCLGANSPLREYIAKCVEIAPLQFMRGRTFHDAVCILDEAQNCNYNEIKLFLTRFGQNSKVIITGDPMQSDLHPRDRALMHVVERLSGLKGVGVIHFKPSSIVRHPLIAGILERLEDKENTDGTSST
jgi:phosphate starvation-inducible PhoH-like protein